MAEGQQDRNFLYGHQEKTFCFISMLKRMTWGRWISGNLRWKIRKKECLPSPLGCQKCVTFITRPHAKRRVTPKINDGWRTSQPTTFVLFAREGPALLLQTQASGKSVHFLYEISAYHGREWEGFYLREIKPYDTVRQYPIAEEITASNFRVGNLRYERPICIFLINAGSFNRTHKFASKYSPPVLLHSTDPLRRMVTIFTTSSNNVPPCSITHFYVFWMNIIKKFIS
jgi:hypothetical protein